MAAPSTTRAGAEARPCTARDHGYAAYSRARCRCALGREAWRLYGKRRREGRHQPLMVDATGTHRRIEGLLYLGWPREQIAVAAGLSDQARLRRILAARMVRRTTADAIRRATAALGGQPGPSGRVRANARAAGYVSLWAWDDDIDDPAAVPSGAVRRPVSRSMPTLTPRVLARFTQYAVPVLGTPHVRWTGPTDGNGRGRLNVGPKSHQTSVSARRIAWYQRYGRPSVGTVVPRCGNAWCVAGPCMVDEGAPRQQQEAA